MYLIFSLNQVRTKKLQSNLSQRRFCLFLNLAQSILWTSSLIFSSLFPKAPWLWQGCLLISKPFLGELNLNGHKKLLAYLKFGPALTISWIKSSTETIPILPSEFSMILLSVKGILDLLTFPYPLLQIKSEMVFLVGYPQVMQGSTFLTMLRVALLSLMKTPLWSCLNLKSYMIFLHYGFNLLIL